MKKYLYEIKLWETSFHQYATITNIRTKKYGCIVSKEEAEHITTRKYYPYSKNKDYYYDVSWMSNYMIDEAIVLLKDSMV